MSPTGVVVMAYGTPAGPDDVEAYYTHVRRGRPPTPELLADLVRRYEAIGGVSPLGRHTRAQAARLGAALDARSPGGFRVQVGYKHAPPFLEDAVEALVAAGVDQLVGLVLAPHYSAASVGEYLSRLRDRAARLAPGLVVSAVDDWHLEPAYLAFLVAEVRRCLSALPEATKVLFSAHSLPERVVAGADPYPDQVAETGAAVAAELGLSPWSDWAVAWQSAGRTPEPWIGPDVVTVLEDLAGTGRAEGVVVCPCGFVSEHLEVLYDLDVEARARAGEVGLAFARTAVVNDDPAVLGALAERVMTLAGATTARR
ncbi:MAG: ferrochelatase [Actinomycetota bacterium]|nr:ferrochelatase [Actinomycetota bacterium]